MPSCNTTSVSSGLAVLGTGTAPEQQPEGPKLGKQTSFPTSLESFNPIYFVPVQSPADFYSCLMYMQVFPPLHSCMSFTPALTEHWHLYISNYLYLLFNDTFYHYLTFHKNKLTYQLYFKTLEGTQANLSFQIYCHYCCLFALLFVL